MSQPESESLYSKFILSFISILKEIEESESGMGITFEITKQGIIYLYCSGDISYSILTKLNEKLAKLGLVIGSIRPSPKPDRIGIIIRLDHYLVAKEQE